MSPTSISNKEMSHTCVYRLIDQANSIIEILFFQVTLGCIKLVDNLTGIVTDQV